MRGTPDIMQNNPQYKTVLLDIYEFFEQSLKDKFSDKKIIVDPGWFW